MLRQVYVISFTALSIMLITDSIVKLKTYATAIQTAHSTPCAFRVAYIAMSVQTTAEYFSSVETDTCVTTLYYLFDCRHVGPKKS